MSRTHRLDDWLMRGAVRIMPPHQRDWARAMAAERDGIGDDDAGLRFAAGCVRAAGWERLRALAPDASWLWPGLAFGMLLLASAAIPGSRSWPLLWLPLGGAVTVLVLGDTVRPLSFGRGVGLAWRAGMLIGLLFFGAELLAHLSSGEAFPAARLAILAAAIACVTALGGGAVAPLVCSRPGAGASTPDKEH